MNQRPAQQNRVAFIGNIPWECTESEILEICRQAGPVLSFRLMIDRETGRSRGFGFCEYVDGPTAENAIRNLSGFEIKGKQLKFSMAEHSTMPQGAIQVSSSVLPSRRRPNLSLKIPSALQAEASADPSPETVKKLLQAISPEVLQELLNQIKVIFTF